MLAKGDSQCYIRPVSSSEEVANSSLLFFTSKYGDEQIRARGSTHHDPE